MNLLNKQTKMTREAAHILTWHPSEYNVCSMQCSEAMYLPAMSVQRQSGPYQKPCLLQGPILQLESTPSMCMPVHLQMLQCVLMDKWAPQTNPKQNNIYLFSSDLAFSTEGLPCCHVAMLKSLQGTPLLDSVLSHHWIIISACSLCGCGLEPDATYLHQGWP